MCVVVVADDVRLERARGRVERIDRRVDPLLDDRAREHRRRVEVREGVRGRRVGEVVGRHVDRLHRGDRALVRRGDPLLQLPHLGGERRLVADGARDAAEQRRHLGARLDEAEDVVDEEQHVLPLVAEVLRHREAGETDAEARPGRLVHLAVDERDLAEDARLLHLEHQIVALARALADTGEDRHARVLLGDVVDQLLDQHRLAHAGAAEEADLAALDVRRDQVDHLDPGLEDLHRRRELAERRRVAVDGHALHAFERRLVVDRLAEHVPDPAEGLLADRDRDRPAGVDHVEPAREPVGRVHRNRADAIVAEMLLHLRDQRRRLAAVAARYLDRERVVDPGQLAGERDVDHDALDLDHLADVLAVLRVRHASPEEVVRE